MSSPNKRRRVIINDDDDDGESVVSNPDEIIDEKVPSDESEGEDLMETLYDDYAPDEFLDQYDRTVLADDEEIIEDYADRVRYTTEAEREIAKREALRRRQHAEDLDLYENAQEEESDEDEYSDDEDEEELGETGALKLNLEAFDCSVSDWIAEERTQKEIERRLKLFLEKWYPDCEEIRKYEKNNKQDDGRPAPLPPHLKTKKKNPIYPDKIDAMCSANMASLEVSYRHLAQADTLLAIWLTEVPKQMLDIFNGVLKTVVKLRFTYYDQIHKFVTVRIVDLPYVDNLRDLRQKDLNNLLKVAGVVTRRTSVFPQILQYVYKCRNSDCNFITPPTSAESPLGNCLYCQQSKFDVVQSKCIYTNCQKLTLQESPGSVPPGRVPRTKDVLIQGDLIDIARPGEEIEVTGVFIYTSNFSKKTNGFPVFNTQIQANCIHKKNSTTNSGLSEDDKRKIRELSQHPQIRERIIKSIAPSIYGHRHIKTAIALSLFGGQAKEPKNGSTHRVRGDINILLLGDPGTAKSQFLKYSEKIAPRSVYTTGKGASAVGLTAGVHKDPMTKEWTLEGGALVLADQGVCLIDEFDKMNEQDRTSIHEAMEQQTISVSKAGIVTSLQARCAVIAAANPIGGRYDASYSLAENVELTDPILQRFDILCVLQDIVDDSVDARLAQFVVNSHAKSHPQYEPEHDPIDDDTSEESTYDDGPEPLSQEMLKKYITYAKAYVKPVMHDADSEKIANLYADLRKQSAATGGVPIAVRHIESVLRMAEASAKMHLRDHVRDDDVDMAIKVMIQSFLQAQKIAVQKQLQKSFKKYIVSGEDSNTLLMFNLQKEYKNKNQLQILRRNITQGSSNAVSRVEIPTTDFEKIATSMNIYDLQSFYSSQLFRREYRITQSADGIGEVIVSNILSDL